MFRRVYQSLLAVIATATQKELARQVRYLKVENEILRSKLPARIPLTDKEKSRLCRFAERFHQTLRHEVLDHFLIFGQKHLDYLTQTFVPCYHRRRPHQSKENQVLSVEPPPRRRKRKTPRRVVAPPTTISLADVKCERQLGGLLKHYHRKAG